MARPLAALVLTEDEKSTLKTWVSRPKSTQRLAQRTKIVLACAEESNNKDAGTRLGVGTARVGT